MKYRIQLFLSIALATALGTNHALAQGCVAAHTNQRTMDQLIQTDQLFQPPDGGSGIGKFSLHNLTVNIGYRVFNSNKYFIGDQEIPRPSAVENHQNIFDVGLEYQLSPRW